MRDRTGKKTVTVRVEVSVDGAPPGLCSLSEDRVLLDLLAGGGPEATARFFYGMIEDQLVVATAWAYARASRGSA